ncbi:hypothetical protein CRE_01222 [Caenorhabditis remanei]|uniref:Uncharacterized protein n=2 Tax=Caenorhabditis remanei TaxID=31234 RepID=E3N4T6_CAERE|nr:hypothetical protein CRE_01222 [Caenorhabditis remanei]
MFYLAVAIIMNCKPKVQKMYQMKLGLIGMILSVQIMNVAVIMKNYKAHEMTAHGIYYIFHYFLLISYALFGNFLTRLYIQLPKERRPYSPGSRFSVGVIAIIHLTISTFSVWNTNHWIVCSILQFSSFIFCVDAYSCFTTPFYKLCEHREYKDYMRIRPVDGVICNVVVRRIYEKTEDIGDVPANFQFDDDVQLEPFWIGDKLTYLIGHREFRTRMREAAGKTLK